MKSVLLDLVEEPWLAAHGRDIVILVIMALIATAAIAGIFIWREKKINEFSVCFIRRA